MKFKKFLNESEQQFRCTFSWMSQNIINDELFFAKDEKEVFNKCISKLKRLGVQKSFSFLINYYKEHTDRYIIKKIVEHKRNKISTKEQGKLL